MALILALDQGTTATTALAVDAARNVVARASIPTPLERPRPGWAESDPLKVLEASEEALSVVLSRIDPADVAALGITNQRETTVAWSRHTGEILAPAVSWQCRRTAELCEKLKRDAGTVELVRARTGLVIDPYFSGTKMRWLIENVRDVARAEERADLLFGTIDAFLVHALTGEHATDPSNASRTMVFDIRKGDWDPELAELVGVPLESLPHVLPSSGRFGEIKDDTRLGATLPQLAGVPVMGVAGDQQASLFGHGCFGAGEAKGTLGTGAFFLVNTGSAPRTPSQGVLSTVAWDLGEGLVYALEGVAFACGSALEWATSVGLIDSPSSLDALAGAVPDAGGARFVPALYGLGAPFWDPNARASITGLSAATTRQHVARAIAEGLAAQNALLLRALEASGQRVEEVRLDGGVSRSDLLCQLLADGARVTVRRAVEGEITALGAAALAGLAQGTWTLKQLQSEEGERFTPRGSAAFVGAYEAAVGHRTSTGKGG